MIKLRRLLLLLSLISIFVMGLVMIFNTTSAEVLDHALTRSTHQALFRQITYAFLGLLLSFGIWMTGYRRLLEWSPYLLFFFSILLFLTLIPGIGKEVNGSRRWLIIGSLSFQPSEFVKYLVPAFFTFRLLSTDPTKLSLKEFCQILILLAIPILLVLVEPNNGTAAVMGLTVVMLCLLSQIRFIYWALPLSVLMMIGALSAYHLPYVTARLQVYLNPELDLKGKGHQPYQAKIAAGSGQLFGRGPGNSLQKMSYLPEAQNDYIAAIYAEEFGFLGMVILISFYMLIGYVGFYIAHLAPDRGGLYMAAVTTFLICFQAFMNLGVVSGLLPSTGLNLPFFSQGGTSLMANMMAVGLLLTIDCNSDEGEEWQLEKL